MDMARALEELGATANLLDENTKHRLETEGFAPLPGVLSAAQLDAFRARIAELHLAEAERAGLEQHQEEGTDRLADLVNKDPMFDLCFTDPRVLAAVSHVLAEFKLSSLSSRAALPGQGHQPLHADWPGVPSQGDFEVCNSLWLLDDFTAENGATRVVPGTHLSPVSARDALADPTLAHPREVLVLEPAGTVVVFNSHLWHGGTKNLTDQPRRALHGYFTRRHNAHWSTRPPICARKRLPVSAKRPASLWELNVLIKPASESGS